MKMAEKNSDEFQEETSLCSLDDIPIELFLHICSFLDPATLNNLNIVCKKFHHILEDQSIWKARVRKRWCTNEKNFPPIPVSEDYNWKGACYDLENNFNILQNPETSWRYFKFGEAHVGEVDSVLLFEDGTRCISASRDHSMIFWDLSNEEIKWTVHNNMHKGWIWNLAIDHQTRYLFSCSFDRTVKIWSLDSMVSPITTFSFNTAVLTIVCTTGQSGQAVAGLLNGTVLHLDHRQPKYVGSYAAHRRATLALAVVNSNHVVSISEDATYAVWDLKAGQLFKSNINLYDDNEARKGKTPLCISYNNDIIYIGDSGGKLHLVNAKDGLYEHLGMYDVGHTDRLTSVHHNRGRLITCSNDASVRFFAPTNEPTHLFTLNSTNKLNKLYYQNHTLALAGCDSSVEFWRHKSLDTCSI